MFRCCLGRGVTLLTGDHSLVVDGLGEWTVMWSPGDDKAVSGMTMMQKCK
jgi:hypothetical protein